MSGRVVGRITRAHGVRGEVSVEVLTDYPDIRFAPGSVLGAPGGRSLVVLASRPHHDRLLVFFEGVGDRTAAEALMGVALTGADELPPPEGALWHDELEGFAALDAGGAVLGEVVEVLANPAHELLVVRTAR